MDLADIVFLPPARRLDAALLPSVTSVSAGPQAPMCRSTDISRIGSFAVVVDVVGHASARTRVLSPRIARVRAQLDRRGLRATLVMIQPHGSPRLLTTIPSLDGLRAVSIAIVFLAHSGLKDRKSTRLNSSHSSISYAVFCLKKKIHELTTTP